MRPIFTRKQGEFAAADYAVKKTKLFCLSLLAVLSVIQYIQLNLSCMSFADVFQIRLKPFLLACGSVLLIDLFLVLITMRLHIACLIGSLFSLLLSIIDHYVYLYTGGLFSPSYFSLVPTGVNVLRGYHFPLDISVLSLFLCFLAEVCISVGIKKAWPEKQKYEKKRFAAYFIPFLVLLICAGYSNIYLYQNTNWILNDQSYAQSCGYVTFFVQKALRCAGASVNVPQGYSPDKIEDLANELQAVSGRAETYPDIILILNETFYDLSLYTDIETDAPYLENYNNLENAIKGYAISPYSMGGTNDSEFELLTGHSSLMFSIRAPFTLPISLKGINSAARYLEALGYTTQASHPCDAMNYDRQTVYPALGFDTVRFYDDFAVHDKYGERIETDAANYQELIQWYEGAGDAPRFLYLLTYQNHGGYEQNDSDLDTVHVKSSFGDVTDQINEYLTSIKMSDEALAALLRYFDDAERPVIVCMVGDHSPSFLSQLPERSGMTEAEKSILSQKIPFLIWANPAFGEMPEEENRVLGMTDLMAQVFYTAGLPLSPYYNCLFELSHTVPIRTGDGYYQIEDDGTMRILDPAEDASYKASIPLYLEYIDLTDESGKWDYLFAGP